MKKTLIITAHPSSQGFVHQISERYISAAKSAGKGVEIINLYTTEEPQPFLNFKDKRKWPTENLKSMQEKITQSDELVFIFPVWWGDAPAILKNWIDYNFSSGFAFKYGANGVEKLLKGKTAKIFATSDAPGFAYGFFLAPMRIMWTHMRLAFCGIKVTDFNVYGTMRKRTEKNKESILQKVTHIAQK